MGPWERYWEIAHHMTGPPEQYLITDCLEFQVQSWVKKNKRKNKGFFQTIIKCMPQDHKQYKEN